MLRQLLFSKFEWDLIRSSLDDTESHEVAAEKDRGADDSEQLASCLELARIKVVVSGLDVVVDLDAIEEHVFSRRNHELLGM